MGKQRTELLLQRREHEHQMKLALIAAMAKDPELKYFLGVAGGAATGMIGSIINGYMGGEEDDNTSDTPAQTSPWYWIISGGVAGVPAAVVQDLANQISTDTSNSGLLGLLPMVGSGFAGFCAFVLIMKAIFGDEDVASLASGMGDLMPGMVPIP